MKKKKQESKLKSNAWITTFTNLMILLLAFFIVLVTLSTADQQRRRLGLNSLFGSFGFKTGGQAVIGSDAGGDITMGEAPIMEEEVELKKLQNVVFSNGLESDVEIRKEAEKMIITLGKRVLFAKGSSRVPQDSIKFLSDLSEILKDGPGLIELRGYADKAESILDPDPLKKSVYLATRRALAILHFFIDKGKIPTDRIVAHGFVKPLMKKEDSMVKKKWRGEVEIIADYGQKIPYRLRVPKYRERFLDYKGFFFKLFEDHNEE